MNKLKNKLSNLGFAGIELILLVTIVAGIAATTRLAQEVQILQKQAATGSCQGSVPTGCTLDNGQSFTCGGTSVTRNETSCGQVAGYTCSNLPTKPKTTCHWVPASGGTNTNPPPPKICTTNGQSCTTSLGCPGKCVVPATGAGGCQDIADNCPGTGVGGNACTWNGSACTVGSAGPNCYIDTGGKECFRIATCNRDPANCQAVQKPCVLNPTNNCVCGGPGQAACGGGGNPPPGGGNPPGGGAVTCSGGNGGKCSTASNPKCVGQKGNANCSDGGKCKELINQTGPDGLHKCNKQGGAGDPPPPVDPPPVIPPVVPPEQITCLSVDSDPECLNKKVDEDCVKNNIADKCKNPLGQISIVDQKPVCTCGFTPAIPVATNTPTPTPTLTPTPTIDPDAPGWFTSYGTRCNAQSYRAFYNDINDCENTDAKPLGYQTENLPGVDPCTAINGIKCYAAIGDKLDSLPGAYKLEKDNICNRTEDNVDNPITKDTEILNEFRECQYKDPPKGQITTSITAIFDDKNKFDQIKIFLVDNNETGKIITLKNKSFSYADFQTNKTQTHNFEKVFTDRSYNVYAKILKKVEGGIVNDTSPGIEIIYECTNGENSGEAACTFPAGEGEAKITVNFPKKSDGDDDFDDLSGQALNNIFLEKIDAWTRGDLNAIQMSEFLLKVKDAPGLKTATCDPTVPGGCQPVF